MAEIVSRQMGDDEAESLALIRRGRNIIAII